MTRGLVAYLLLVLSGALLGSGLTLYYLDYPNLVFYLMSFLGIILCSLASVLMFGE